MISEFEMSELKVMIGTIILCWFYFNIKKKPKKLNEIERVIKL